MVFYIAVWQALDIVPSSRKGYRGDLSSQSPEMPTTNLASLTGIGALLQFLNHKLVLQCIICCYDMWRISKLCFIFSGEAENSGSPEVKKISFAMKSPPKKKGASSELAKLAGFNPSPELGKKPDVGKKSGVGGKK